MISTLDGVDGAFFDPDLDALERRSENASGHGPGHQVPDLVDARPNLAGSAVPSS